MGLHIGDLPFWVVVVVLDVCTELRLSSLVSRDAGTSLARIPSTHPLDYLFSPIC